jgi:hypothetical protein
MAVVFLLLAFFLNVFAFIINAGLGYVGLMILNGTMAVVCLVTFLCTREDY